MNLYWGKLWLDLMLSAGLNDSCQYGESGDRCQLVAPCLAAIGWLPFHFLSILCMDWRPVLQSCSQLSSLAIYWNSLLQNATKREHNPWQQVRYDLQHARTDLMYLYRSNCRWAIAIKISTQNTNTSSSGQIFRQWNLSPAAALLLEPKLICFKLPCVCLNEL